MGAIMTDDERAQRKRASNRRTRLRTKGYAIPYQRKGAPVVYLVRCPVCHEPISATKDCRCP